MTAGFWTIAIAPSTAIVANQTIMMGPKSAPMLAVPRRWITKSPISTTRVMGRMYGLNVGVMISRPSTAESTEMAGVITPSP